MSKIQKINEYINKTHMPGSLSDRYPLGPEDLIAIVRGCQGNAYASALLAFTYGKAKGYRAGRSEAQHDQH